MCSKLCQHFDIITDKGTLDAISLSCDKDYNLYMYLNNLSKMFRNNCTGVLIICSCNFTETELVTFVTNCDIGEKHFRFVCSIAAQNSFTFGGCAGQTTCVCVFEL
jgi:hypothetical protein